MKLPERKRLRLKDYNYSQDGWYFVTICTYNKEKLFGKDVGADSISARTYTKLNSAGNMIEKELFNLQNCFQNVILDEYIIMPNHFHGIITLKWSDTESSPAGLQSVIQAFKRSTTIEYIKMVKQGLLPLFDKQIWQRSYYDHIIRDEHELNAIREYIANNPSKWEEDEYYI